MLAIVLRSSVKPGVEMFDAVGILVGSVAMVAFSEAKSVDWSAVLWVELFGRTRAK